MITREQYPAGRATAVSGLWSRVCVRKCPQWEPDGESARQRTIQACVFRARITGWRPVCVLLSSYTRAGGGFGGTRCGDDEL